MALPTITEQPKDVNSGVYKSVSFKCTAHGYGAIKIIWKRSKHNMPVTAEVIEEKSLNQVSSITTINSIFGYYMGQYYCIAESEAGMVVSQTANLLVQGNMHVHRASGA